MNPQKLAIGTPLLLSSPIVNTTASAIGIAKTGTAIGTLQGAAHTSATAAWIGLGSMKLGMLMMGAMPVVGAILILDGLCGRDSGSPLINWEEEFWRQYETQCELEDLKQQITVDRDHQLRAKTKPASLTQLNQQFRSLEIEHELYQMKKDLGLI